MADPTSRPRSPSHQRTGVSRPAGCRRVLLTPVASGCYVAAMRGLTDKVAVVAGGAGGIGTASSVRLAEEGAAVVVGDLDGDAARGGRRPDQRRRRAGRRRRVRHRRRGVGGRRSSTSRSTTYGGLDLPALQRRRARPRHHRARQRRRDGAARRVRPDDRGQPPRPLPVHAAGDPAPERARRRRDRVHRVGRRVHRRAGATVVRDRQERDHRAGPPRGLTLGQGRHPRQRDRARPDHDARGRRRDDGGPRARVGAEHPARANPRTSRPRSRSCCPTTPRGSTARCSASTAAARCARPPRELGVSRPVLDEPRLSTPVACRRWPS